MLKEGNFNPIQGEKDLLSQKFSEKYKQELREEREAKKREKIEECIEQGQFEDKTREGIKKILEQEISQKQVEIAKVWLSRAENKRKMKKNGYDPDNKNERYIIRAVEEMGGFEELKESNNKDYQKKDQEIEYLQILERELDEDNVPLDSQLLMLNVLNKRVAIIESERISLNGKGDKEGAAKKQEELDNLFEIRKQTAEKITGENLMTKEELEKARKGEIRKEEAGGEDNVKLHQKKLELEKLKIDLKKLENKFLIKVRPGIRKNIEEKRNKIKAKEEELIKVVEEGKINKLCELQGAEKRINTFYQRIKDRRIDKFIEKKIKGEVEHTAKELKDMGIKKEINVSGMLFTALDRENEIKKEFNSKGSDAFIDFWKKYGIEVDKTKLDKAIKELQDKLKEQNKTMNEIGIRDCFLYLFEDLL